MPLAGTRVARVTYPTARARAPNLGHLARCGPRRRSRATVAVPVGHAGRDEMREAHGFRNVPHEGGVA